MKPPIAGRSRCLGRRKITDPGKKRKAPKSWKRKHRADSESSEKMATRTKLERKVPVESR